MQRMYYEVEFCHTCVSRELFKTTKIFLFSAAASFMYIDKFKGHQYD